MNERIEKLWLWIHTQRTKRDIPKAILQSIRHPFHYHFVVATAFHTSSLHSSRCHHFELQNSREICVNCSTHFAPQFFFLHFAVFAVCLFVSSNPIIFSRRSSFSFSIVAVFIPLLFETNTNVHCIYKLLLFGGSIHSASAEELVVKISRKITSGATDAISLYHLRIFAVETSKLFSFQLYVYFFLYVVIQWRKWRVYIGLNLFLRFRVLNE